MSPRGVDFGANGASRNPALGAPEQSTFGFIHRHTGQSGDGQRVKAASLDTTDPFILNEEPIYITASGRRYRVVVIEQTDLETGNIQPVVQAVPVT